MKMKRLAAAAAAALILAVSAASLTACGGSTEPVEEPTSSAPAESVASAEEQIVSEITEESDAQEETDEFPLGVYCVLEETHPGAETLELGAWDSYLFAFNSDGSIHITTDKGTTFASYTYEDGKLMIEGKEAEVAGEDRNKIYCEVNGVRLGMKRMSETDHGTYTLEDGYTMD